jgi:hypothetical protein
VSYNLAAIPNRSQNTTDAAIVSAGAWPRTEWPRLASPISPVEPLLQSREFFFRAIYSVTQIPH